MCFMCMCQGRIQGGGIGGPMPPPPPPPPPFKNVRKLCKLREPTRAHARVFASIYGVDQSQKPPDVMI